MVHHVRTEHTVAVAMRSRDLVASQLRAKHDMRVRESSLEGEDAVN